MQGGIDRSPPDDVLACQNTGSRVQVKNGWILASDGSRFHSLDNTSDVVSNQIPDKIYDLGLIRGLWAG